jgi:hypothetical protein
MTDRRLAVVAAAATLLTLSDTEVLRLAELPVDADAPASRPCPAVRLAVVAGIAAAIDCSTREVVREALELVPAVEAVPPNAPEAAKDAAEDGPAALDAAKFTSVVRAAVALDCEDAEAASD